MTCRLSVFVAFFILFSSCYSVSTINIQVLEPAEEPVTPEYSNFIILNRTISAENRMTFEEDTLISNRLRELTNKTTTEIIFALAGILNESPGTDFIDTTRLLEINREHPDMIPEPLDYDFVMYLCDSLDANAVISLELANIKINDTVAIVGAGGRNFVADRYYTLDINVNIAVLWRIYENSEGRMAEEHHWFDTLRWQYSSYDREELHYYSPSLEVILMETAYFAAIEYARRISPYWLAQERQFFAGGNRNLRLASNFMKNNQYDHAESIYLGLLDSRNRNIIAAAAYNLAYIYEMRGDYRQALVWVRRSNQYRRHPLTSEYIQILEERVEKAFELDRQLGINP